jgi:hypothetical protein
MNGRLIKRRNHEGFAREYTNEKNRPAKSFIHFTALLFINYIIGTGILPAGPALRLDGF